MPSSTVEDYLKQIYLKQQRTRKHLVPMGTLATSMGVAPGTATAMIKTLADSGLVDYAPRNGVRLTRSGEQLALHVLRRHRLLELFLVEVLGLDWSEVHQEAEELEHAISDKVLARIDVLLGEPGFDPHGDPIPDANGRIRRVKLKDLTSCRLGVTFRVAQVMDQDARFLRFVHDSCLTPGTHVVVEQRDSASDSVRVKPDEAAVVVLGATAAGKILVEEVG